ncbi:DUF397 domain-containing protein [Kitasatospora sp. NPDC059160]|uniref:DUF397 domain-containing protein n=1 Tax=Kitasatospora sp. NPDC059160 TaxID=3346748 RepID=UPI0036BD5873
MHDSMWQKSSYSGANNACVEVRMNELDLSEARMHQWQKASYSAANNECVEVRAADRSVELRESDDGHLVLRTTPAALAALLQGIKAGEFDHHA